MKRLVWRFFAPHRESYRVARQHFLPGRPPFPHHHDYAEVFWIESGEGAHAVNGTTHPLEPGDLVLIRPQDRHDLVALKPEGLRLVNISFPAPLLSTLRQRYFPHQKDFWGGPSPLPARHRLAPAQRERLSIEVQALARAPRSLFHIDRFLLNLLAVLTPHRRLGNRPAADIPAWLIRACDDIQKPEQFARGARQFARLAGRSPEHVARSVRLYFKRTPGDIVNDARLQYAAEQLALTDRPIIDIVDDCGLRSLAHFYTLFRARHGLAPRRYRLQQHALLQ